MSPEQSDTAFSAMRSITEAGSLSTNSQDHPDKGDSLISDTEESRQIQRVALFAFLINFGLVVLKVTLAHFSGSLAVVASAIDSGADCVASLAVLGGLKLSTRKTTAFPYGLYKIENMISVVVAVFIFLAGFEIAHKVLLSATQPPKIGLSIIVWLLAGTVITFLFGQYAIAMGKRTESPTLIAEGRHRQVDVLSTIVVLLSLGLNYFGVRTVFFGITIDHIAAGIVVIFIAHAGWELLSDGMRVLLDASLPPETLGRVREIIESEPMVIEVRWLEGRNAGRFRFIETCVVLRTGDLKRAHKASEDIEEKIRKQVPHIERVVIHYEPQVREYLHIAVPLANTAGKVSAHFGEAPYFAFVLLRLDNKHIERQEVVANPHTDISKAKGIRVAEWLIKKKVDIVVVKEDLRSKGPAYVFANGGVELNLLRVDELRTVIESFRK